MDGTVYMKSFQEEFADIKQLCESDDFKYEIERTKQILSQKPLVLYGAGAVGVSVVRTLRHYGIEADCFCDKSKTGIQKETGLLIISPQVLISDYADANIIICSVNYADEIRRDLFDLNINQDRIFSRDSLLIHEMTIEDIEQYIAGYERVYSLYRDNRSKQIVLGRIKYYLTSLPLDSSPSTNQYFDPELITPSCGEIFVDGGMYTGDTAECFFEWVGVNYTHYYGFEPDGENYSFAMKNLEGRRNVTIIQKGLWSGETQLSFSGNLTSSSKLTDEESAGSIGVISLDEYFIDKEPPTFIKMDIEGAEFEALKGAERIIRENKPKLAVCAYHKPEDIYTLPELIKSFCVDYQFYLRHYTNFIYETVLYAL